MNVQDLSKDYRDHFTQYDCFTPRRSSKTRPFLNPPP